MVEVLITIKIPTTIEKAFASPEANKWREAMAVEMGNLHDHGTYVLVDCPPNRKPIGVKWVFDIKINA
jgi:hypothetical protein